MKSNRRLSSRDWIYSLLIAAIMVVAGASAGAADSSSPPPVAPSWHGDAGWYGMTDGCSSWQLNEQRWEYWCSWTDASGDGYTELYYWDAAGAAVVWYAVVYMWDSWPYFCYVGGACDA